MGCQLPVLAIAVAIAVFPTAATDMKDCAVVTNGKVVDAGLRIEPRALKKVPVCEKQNNFEAYSCTLEQFYGNKMF